MGTLVAGRGRGKKTERSMHSCAVARVELFMTIDVPYLA